ncbi:MAG: alpha/beta hydrolase [Methyloceanibacter sp.]
MAEGLTVSASEPQFLDLGQGANPRRLAYRLTGASGGDKPGLLWLSGFLSDMASTKALALADWAEARGVAMLRFDYSGHGLSQGDFLDATIGDWLEEASAMLGLLLEKTPRAIVVGSSMGGWIALLLARKLAAEGGLRKLAGLVLIAPAWDMTRRLMWNRMSDDEKTILACDGVFYQPSLYGDPYPITKRLIEEGRKHLMGAGPLALDLPVRILQGMRDPDVPWRHALELVERIGADDVELTLVKDGDHRLSREQDLRRLEAIVAALVTQVLPPSTLRHART